MKQFGLILSFLVFAIKLNSQIEMSKGQLLVEKDSISFYSFSFNGVSSFVVVNDSIKAVSYKKYSKTIPKEVANLESINRLEAVKNSIGEVYFIYPGGGLLFQYKNNAIERIDNSFPHRNQFSGHFFSYKSELYLLGGYGYWKSNSILTKFNFTSKEWDFVETFGSAPELGINSGSFVLDNDILYVFDFYQKIEDVDKKNDDLFEFDLKTLTWTQKGVLNKLFYDDIQRKTFEINIPYGANKYLHKHFNSDEFDLKTLTWTQKGVLNKLFYDDIQRKTFEINIPYGANKYLHKDFNSDEFLIIEPSKNLVSTYSNPDLNILRDKAIIVGSKIIYSQLSGDRSFETLIMKDLYDGAVLVDEAYLSNDFDLFLTYFIGVGVFCLLLIVFTVLKFKNDTFYFFLNTESVIGLNKSLKITSDDKFVLELLSNANNNQIDNVYFLNYFKDGSISNDANIKRKNKAINDLNNKFLEKFGLNIIEKTSSKTDSRQVVYKLNPKIILKSS